MQVQVWIEDQGGDDGVGPRLYSVREVISPETLRLDTGVSVQLLGVAE